MGSQISTSVTIIDSLYGFQALSLTGFDTSSAPSIAAGSKVEIAGGFFSFSSDESINATSWSAIATGDTAYILLTPAGTAGTQTVTASWTDTEPEWSDAKQGYYASAGSNIRAIGGCYKTSSTAYDEKFLYNGRFKYLDQFSYNSRKPTGTYQSANFLPATLYGYLSPLIPVTGQTIIMSGSAFTGSSHQSISYASRRSSTEIDLHLETAQYTIDASMTSDVGSVNVAW